MFKTMKPYAPPPPPGAPPPPLWGNEDHVRTLLGDRVSDITARRQSVTVDRFETPTEWRDYFKANYGPTIAVYKPSPRIRACRGAGPRARTARRAVRPRHR